MLSAMIGARVPALRIGQSAVAGDPREGFVPGDGRKVAGEGGHSFKIDALRVGAHLLDFRVSSRAGIRDLIGVSV